MKKPAPGVVIGDKYRLQRQLASGGMGSVWVARHLQLDIDVAIKFMTTEAALSPDGRSRFEREAKAAALLHSPYVVSVQDFGVDDDLPYMVMELLHGEDLEERLRRSDRLSPEETMTLLAQAAKGLGRAHELGILHRDLKPRNLFLTSPVSMHDDEIVKILDFGIAKHYKSFGVVGATTSHHLVGSPNYMSPEQIRGMKDIDHRSDLWSLGVILYQAMTGVLPFEGEVLIDVLNKVASGPITPPTELVPELPAGTDTFFLRALARDRAARFQSIREMVDAFAELVLGMPAVSRPPPIGRDSRDSTAPGGPSGTPVSRRRPGYLGDSPRRISPMAETLAAEAPSSLSPHHTPSAAIKMVRPPEKTGSEKPPRVRLASLKNFIVLTFVLIGVAAAVINVSSWGRRAASQDTPAGLPPSVSAPLAPSPLIHSPVAPAAPAVSPAASILDASRSPSPTAIAAEASASPKKSSAKPASVTGQKQPRRGSDQDPEKWGF
ncbi:MAG: serine/threonine protein kinase [Polyangiaceae bacterium]|nr:serine/threonine protein kinase [Polyangiaceae bacterium]